VVGNGGKWQALGECEDGIVDASEVRHSVALVYGAPRYQFSSAWHTVDSVWERKFSHTVIQKGYGLEV